MSDNATGIAVLDTENSELYVRCRKRDGNSMDVALPVHEKGTPRFQDRIWSFRKVGDTLHLSPALTMPAVPFHTEYEWSVRFELFQPAKYESPKEQLVMANGYGRHAGERLHD